MRVSFPAGEQREFMGRAISKLSVSEIAEVCGLSKRTIRDWCREKFTMDLKAANKIAEKSEISLPRDMRIKDDYWYASKGDPSVGGKAVYEKYGRIGGDPEYRKKKWREWWEKEGKFKKHKHLFVRKSIKRPEKSPKLAEFVGIILGDGSINSKQVSVSLNNEKDKEYIKIVRQMFKNLFGLKPSVIPQKEVACSRILASSMNLVDFLVKLGLIKGDKIKHQVDIPNWIKTERRFKIACTRGLIDTDGCIFTHKYQVNGKQYSYKKISFRSYSKPLIGSVQEVLKELDLNPRMATVNDLRLENENDTRKYFKIVGSHNPKHLKRYRE